MMLRVVLLSCIVAAVFSGGCRKAQPVLPAGSPPAPPGQSARPTWSTPESRIILADSKHVREAAIQATKDLRWNVVTEMKTTTGGAMEVGSPAGERLRLRFQSAEGGGTSLSIESTTESSAAYRDEFFRRVEELSLAAPPR